MWQQQVAERASGGTGAAERRRGAAHRACGFTLAELVLGAMVLAIAIAAILGAYVGQVTLNEHARNLSLAIQDASRVIEQIRQDNTSCGASPKALWPSGTSWDSWLANAGGGKSLTQNIAIGNELVVVTCQDRDGTTPSPWLSCSSPPPGTNPLRVTVTVCWRHRQRTIGECTWNAGTSTLTADETVVVPGDTNVIDSPAMLTTLVTCRG